ncbi:MAG: multiheme c-type cytochrome [Thermodesulfobacteriota bacterium]
MNRSRVLHRRLALPAAAACLLALLALSLAGPAWATPYFSAQTNKPCSFCHESPQGGSSLTPQGYAFRAAGFYLDPKALPVAWRSWLNLLAGFVHIATAIVWFGAIFYIHLFIKPRALVRGVPQGERLLGLGSIILLALSGAVLTWLRVPNLEALLHTTFGIVWMVKVFFFLLMVATAVLVNTWLHRRLQADAEAASRDPLAQFDGQEGRPAHIAYSGQLYDVGGSKLWPGGEHMRRHRAGRDLTADLAAAPHGPEVLERLPKLGPAPASPDPEALGPTARLLVVLAYLVLGCMLVILLCLAWWNWGPPLVPAAEPFRPQLAQACVGCHQKATPAVHHDWGRSAHARAKVSCLHCHQAGRGDRDIDQRHQAYFASGQGPWAQARYAAPVAAVVTPRDCSRCHLRQSQEYARSKHAASLSIIWRSDPWLNQGLSSPLERSLGCLRCHGSMLKADAAGRLDPATWPNTGVGRVNLDRSRGSCSACHGRHAFSLAQARRPEACGVCHLGPGHPQMEIYAESKHGAIYRSQGHTWRWDAPPETWTAGVDYRTPTCAACHMSAAGRTPATHDVGRRLAWELQAPLTVRPQDFAPWPAQRPWQQARQEMRGVCLSCHSPGWTDSHFKQLDATVREYNELYFRPVQAKLEVLYDKGLLPRDAFFHSPLWTTYYELWHHEGRRARLGAAMMAPDYAWWHGFYELKQRYTRFMQRADHLLASGQKAYLAPVLPGAIGSRRPPAALGEPSRWP